MDKSLTKVRGTITIEVKGDWDYDAREMLDWIEAKLSEPLPTGWGDGKGSINYATGKVVAVRRET